MTVLVGYPLDRDFRDVEVDVVRGPPVGWAIFVERVVLVVRVVLVIRGVLVVRGMLAVRKVLGCQCQLLKADSKADIQGFQRYGGRVKGWSFLLPHIT